MRRLGWLKNFCPMSVMFRLKYVRQFCNQAAFASGAAVPRIYYLDAPSYGNVGDQAIAYAIKMFARKYFPEYEFVEVLQDELPQYIAFLKRTIRAEDIIFLTGGGNMGNIYRIFEAARRFVIRSFPDNPIYVFPQTVEYTNGFFGSLSRRMSQKVYQSHKDLTLTAREKFSFEKMIRWYPKTRVLLCPDIALSLAVEQSGHERRNVGVCLRDDIERVLSDQDREEIVEKIGCMGKEPKAITTTTEEKNITRENRESIVLNKLKEISRFELLVTDRLHGMIFAILTGTPCIVFENSNKKIAGVYECVKDYPAVMLLKGTDDFFAAAEKMLNPEKSGCAQVSFGHLVEAIRGG